MLRALRDDAHPAMPEHGVHPILTEEHTAELDARFGCWSGAHWLAIVAWGKRSLNLSQRVGFGLR